MNNASNTCDTSIRYKIEKGNRETTHLHDGALDRVRIFLALLAVKCHFLGHFGVLFQHDLGEELGFGRLEAFAQRLVDRRLLVARRRAVLVPAGAATSQPAGQQRKMRGLAVMRSEWVGFSEQ